MKNVWNFRKASSWKNLLVLVFLFYLNDFLYIAFMQSFYKAMAVDYGTREVDFFGHFIALYAGTVRLITVAGFRAFLSFGLIGLCVFILFFIEFTSTTDACEAEANETEKYKSLRTMVVLQMLQWVGS